MKVGDGGQSAYASSDKEDNDYKTLIKHLWLFDMEQDPTETTDLSKTYPDVVKELQQKLNEYKYKQQSYPYLTQQYFWPNEVLREARRLYRSAAVNYKEPSLPTVIDWFADAPERQPISSKL